MTAVYPRLTSSVDSADLIDLVERVLALFLQVIQHPNRDIFVTSVYLSNRVTVIPNTLKIPSAQAEYIGK